MMVDNTLTSYSHEFIRDCMCNPRSVKIGKPLRSKKGDSYTSPVGGKNVCVKIGKEKK